MKMNETGVTKHYDPFLLIYKLVIKVTSSYSKNTNFTRSHLAEFGKCTLEIFSQMMLNTRKWAWHGVKRNERLRLPLCIGTINAMPPL